MKKVLTVIEVARPLGRLERWLRDSEQRGKLPEGRRDLNVWRVYTAEDVIRLRRLIIGSWGET